MYLLDTDVVSQTAKRRPHSGVMVWLSSQQPESLFLSVITLAEVRFGIRHHRRRDPAHADALESWLRALMIRFSDRVLPVDATIALRWGDITSHAKEHWADRYIAATAIERGLTVATRNTKDFAKLGVPLIDPFDSV
jgi:predicted nucleic acid-binding protein